jgi:hypothetical protein
VVVIADPLVEVAVRVYADFADRATWPRFSPSSTALATTWTPLAPPRCPSWSTGWPGNGSTREEHGGEPHW